MSAARKPVLHHLHDYVFPHARNRYRPHLFSTLSLTLIALTLIACEAGYLVQTKYVFIRTDFLASVLPSALVALANQDRAANGLPAVTEDPLLDEAARAAARDMASRGYFSHVSPDGTTPWHWLDLVGYRYAYAGQNLAVNFTDSQNVETAWMNSPTHRANIEKPQYTRIGVGTANGVYEGEETTFVVEFFATPAPASAPVARRESGGEAEIPRPGPPVSVLGAEIVSPLSSPATTFKALLAILFSLIAVSFAAAMLVRRSRAHHPRVALGAAFLFLLIAGTLLFNASNAELLRIPADGQFASVISARAF